jgi:hypothetical protein
MGKLYNIFIGKGEGNVVQQNIRVFGSEFQTVFHQNLILFCFNFFFVFLDRFDELISKINFKK